MKRILVLGYFGFLNNQLDGQTVKTRNVYALLKERSAEINSEITYFDTQLFKRSKRNVFSMLTAVLKSDKIFYLGAHDNLKFIFPFLMIICQFLRKDIHVLLVGGWLAEFLRNKPLHRFMLKRVKGVYPETRMLCDQLCREYGFQNVHQLKNFRMRSSTILPHSSEAFWDTDRQLRLVFMARVQPMKGIEVLFQLADKLEAANITNVVIDIYGPIARAYDTKFKKEISRFNVVRYQGLLQPDQIHEVLREYHLMLFPTKYFSEGFPGSILDAYMAGIPVVVTKWKYAEEFVEPNVSGLICQFDDDEEFISSVLRLVDNRQLIEVLRQGAVRKAAEYCSNAAWKTLRHLI